MTQPRSEEEALFERQLDAKQARRRVLAALPIEEKVSILIRLQELACAIRGSREPVKKPWRLQADVR